MIVTIKSRNFSTCLQISQNKNGSNNNSSAKIPEQHLDASKQEFLDSHLSDLKKNDAFVTVINVSSASSADAPSSVPPPLPPPTTATNSNYKSSDDNQSSGNQNSGGQKKIALSNSEKSASLPLASSKRASKKPAILPTGSKIQPSNFKFCSNLWLKIETK